MNVNLTGDRGLGISPASDLTTIESYNISACAMRHVRGGIIPALVRCGEESGVRYISDAVYRGPASPGLPCAGSNACKEVDFRPVRPRLLEYLAKATNTAHVIHHRGEFDMLGRS